MRSLIRSVGLLVLVQPALAQVREGPRPEVRGIIKVIDAKTGTLTLSAQAFNRDAPASEKTYSLAKDVEVAVGGFFRAPGVFKEAKLTDLEDGLVVLLSLS